MKANQLIPSALLIVTGLLLTCADTQAQEGTEVQTQPNIVFFLVDDMGWMDTGVYGSPLYETPAVDRLASQGVRFTQAYAAHPRCVPSRAAIMTGKFPARLKSPGPWEGHLPLSEVTLAEALQQAGYVTFFAGKWHLGGEGALPSDQGFDLNIAGGAAGAPGSYFWPYNKPKTRGHRTAAPLRGLDQGQNGEYLNDRLTDEAIKFLNDHQSQRRGQPFLMYLSHYAVHTPLEAKQEHKKIYKRKLENMTPLPGPQFVDEGTGRTKMRQDNPVYAGMVQSVDESLGRLTAELESLGLSDHTVIIFTSDHGGLSNCGWNINRLLATSNAPLRAGKGHLYEGGVRVPLIVKWPGVTGAGSESDQITISTDFYPTLLEMAGLDLLPDQHLDGVSFAGVLKGTQHADPDRPIFWHSPISRPYSTGDSNSSAVRQGDWKIIEFYDAGKIELYNLREDIGETNNLAETHADKADELLALLHAWRKEVDAFVEPDKGRKRLMKKKPYREQITAYLQSMEQPTH